MTDEEIAEGYYNSKFKSNESHFSKFDIEQAFLAGLNAGRPEWHKVADGDLPKETDEYLTNIGVLTWDYYNDGRYGWHTEYCNFCDCCDDIDSDEVIAWCEIPTFTDKE